MSNCIGIPIFDIFSTFVLPLAMVHEALATAGVEVGG